jgi:hypothetical protein
MATRLFGAFVVAIASLASHAEATELRIRVPRPAGYPHAVQLKTAQLLLAWWGDKEIVPLTHRYEANDLVVIVPLDRELWKSPDAAQPPDFGYVYLAFEDFVPVLSERFCWLRGTAPVPSPVNWETVSAIRFGFRGGAPVDIRDGETREVSLAARRPVPKQLRFVDDRGRPVSDITVDGGMFWSAHNHCGVPAGMEPLFANRRPNVDGILTVPDGDIEYGLKIGGGSHVTVIEPPPDEGFFRTHIDASELVVRVRRHIRVPLTLRVTIGGKPPGRILVGASAPVSCGVGSGPLGQTDSNGVLRVPDFYPEELDAICIAGRDGHPIWAIAPPDYGQITVDLPATASIGETSVCYLRKVP